MPLSALILVGSALAGGGDRFAGLDDEPAPRSVSVTLSPLRLMGTPMYGLGAAPMLDGAAELRLTPTRSVSFTGARSIGPEPAAREYGLQVREYFAGDFSSGVAGGARVTWENPDVMRMRSDAMRFGPFLAIKVTMALFTIEARGGPEVTLTPQAVTVAPAVDVSAGVSF